MTLVGVFFFDLGSLQGHGALAFNVVFQGVLVTAAKKTNFQ